MEGLGIVELQKNEYVTDECEFRLDAEYFAKENLRLLESLCSKKIALIDDFCYVTDGIHESIDYCETSCVNLFSATTPKQNYFDLSRQVFISEKSHLANPRTALLENDVIISTVGTIGNCAVVNKSVLPANADRHVGIIRLTTDSVKPRYLSTFLLTKFGRFQTWRESTGNVQLNLFLHRIRTLKVAIPSFQFQNAIEEVISSADRAREKSNAIYAGAQALLLSFLGLANFKPSLESINIKSFKDSFGTSGRIDAEYYQPKYEQMVAHIAARSHATLGSLVEIQKSIEPGSDAYTNDAQGMPFLRVADYSKQGMMTPKVRLSGKFVNENAAKLTILKPKQGTILFSKDGSVGEAYCLREDANFITSGAILHLTVKDKTRVLPDYLTLALNSIVVKEQAERDAGGSIILHWRKEEIENVLVPLIDMPTQQKIAAQIEESFALKMESERLLEVAKYAVEIAIERDEAAALDHIKISL